MRSHRPIPDLCIEEKDWHFTMCSPLRPSTRAHSGSQTKNTDIILERRPLVSSTGAGKCACESKTGSHLQCFHLLGASHVIKHVSTTQFTELYMLHRRGSSRHRWTHATAAPPAELDLHASRSGPHTARVPAVLSGNLALWCGRSDPGDAVQHFRHQLLRLDLRHLAELHRAATFTRGCRRGHVPQHSCAGTVGRHS